MSEAASKYVEQVISLLGLNKEAGAGTGSAPPGAAAAPGESAPEPARPAPAAQPQERDAERFEQGLQALAAQRDTREGIVAGRIHMFNADAVRQRLGKRWPKFADRVHDIIKTELKLRLGPRDLFTKIDGDCYLVVFGDCSEMEARLKAAMLSEQILEKLLGEAEAKDIQALGVQRLVTRADGTVAAEALESTDALAAMLDRAEASGAETEAYDYEDMAAGRRALTPEEVARLLGGVDGELAQAEGESAGSGAPVVKIDRLHDTMKQLARLEDAMRAREPAFAPSQERDKAETRPAGAEGAKPAFEMIRERRRRTERQIVFRYDRDPSAAGGEPTEMSLRIDFTYHPMWHAPSNKIGIYVCHAILRDGDGAMLRFEEMDAEREAEVRAVVDRLALRRVRDDFDKAAAKGIPNVMMAPVHFSTLQRHGSRTSFLEICSRLPETQRMALSWEILDSHVESWSLQLKSVIKPIAPFSSAIFLRLPDLQRDFARVRHNLPFLRHAGVHAVGVDVAALRGPEAEKLRLLENIAQLAESHGLKCYGHGFHSLSMTTNAVCMGYLHVSGLAIAAPVQKPGGVRATEMETICGRALFEAAG